MSLHAGNLMAAMDLADRDELIEFVFPEGRLPLLTQVSIGFEGRCHCACLVLPLKSKIAMHYGMAACTHDCASVWTTHLFL